MACHIANMALDSCALHLETGGVYLVAALLDRKNLPVPIPLDRVSDLIRSCVKSLAPRDKKYKVSLSLLSHGFQSFLLFGIKGGRAKRAGSIFKD